MGSFTNQTLIDYQGVYTAFAEDLNDDGDVDLADLQFLLSSYGT